MRVWHALIAAVLLLTRISAEASFCDVGVWGNAVNSSCFNDDPLFLKQLILNASACASSPQFQQDLRVFTPYSFLNQSLQLRDSEVNFTVLVLASSSGSSASVNATAELNRDILSYYDGFVLDAEVLPEFAQAGVAAPVNEAIISEPELNWFRISRYYRGFAATHLAGTYGVPLGGAGVFTFYRQDLFEQFNLTVPTTWDGLLSTARAWKAAQYAPGVLPFCMSWRPYCARTVLLTIAAPYIQASGTRDGFLIDPGSGKVLLNSTGFIEALGLWQQLYELAGSQDANTSCSTGMDSFVAGACLITLQPFEKFKVYASKTSAVRGKLGIALPPGSSQVMDRTTGEMQNCTKTVCPFAVSIADTTSDAAGSIWVNYAPFMYGGLVGIVNARNPSYVRSDVLHYLAQLASIDSLDNVLRSGSRIAPFRVDHWSPAAKRNWTDAGFDEDDAAQMMDVLRVMHSSPNLVPQLRLPGFSGVMSIIGDSLAGLTAGASVKATADSMQAATENLLLEKYGTVNGTNGYLTLYRQQLGYANSSSTDAEAPTKSHNSSAVSRQTVVVIAVVIGLVMLLAAAVVLEVRNKRRHKDLLGRVKAPLGDPDTTIVVASIQDFDELWEALISDASERALQQFSDLVDSLLRRYSGYRAPSEEEDVVVAFHCPRDACEFALELQRELLGLRWPKHVLEMEQFRPRYLAQTKRATSFSQSYNGSRPPTSPLAGAMPQTEDEDKLFTLDTGVENVRSFGEQCVASWSPAEATSADAELVFCGIRACVGVCAVGFSRLAMDVEPGHKRFTFMGEAVQVAAAAAAAAQGGMVLIPQSTFRQLHLEVLADQCLFFHLGEYQLTSELSPMDLYLALDRQLLGRLALFGPLTCHMQWSQGAFAAPVHSASMVFTHVVGVQTLLAWDYDLMQDVIETFTKLAQVELQQAGGYLVEHVEGFMLTAFHSPADAILWGLRMQELMLKEDWPEELLAHELCEEVTVTVPVRAGEVTSATVFRGPRLKTGIDIGHVLARLHTMTGRMTYRGKVMNRAARISAAASSGQVLCSAEAWESCTASASALRLVTATSLGLFQLKGIQERIEVFHCTYQRHAPSSTRRSSTVSVGIVSSSDNRRKSAVALSSVSHLSQHTTSYRTSMHNSVALEHVSTSDTTGGRRGSQASSQPLVVRGSLGGGQTSDMLHVVGADAERTNVSTSSPGPQRAGVGGVVLSSWRSRSALVPVVVGGVVAGGDGSCGGAAGLVPPSQAGISHRSHGSGASGSGRGGGGGGPGAGAPASGVALAAVLQSRTRSASAIHPSSNMAPIRSASARQRRPLGLPGGAITSEPQVSLAAGGVPPAMAAAAKWNAAMATSPSATPSLAMAAAAAAAAAHERFNSNVNGAFIGSSTNSPKAAAALDMPRGGSANANLIDSSSTISNLAGVSYGTNVDSVATVAAAVYAVLPSVVLSGGLTSSGGVPMASAAHAGGATGAAVHDPLERKSSTMAGAPSTVSSGAGGRSLLSTQGVFSGGVPMSQPRDSSSPVELQMATIATCVEELVQAGRDGSGGAGSSDSDGANCAQLSTSQRAAAQQRRQAQRQRQAMSSSPQRPFHFERMVPLQTLPMEIPQVPEVTGGDVYVGVPDDRDGRGTPASARGGSFDDGSRVETLEVTVSATGIVRGGLSGAASSNGFGAALGSSQGASASRCGSVTAGISCLAMSGGLGLGSPGNTVAGGIGGNGTGGGAGSHVSSCASSGFGHVSYPHSYLLAARPQSSAVWRSGMSMSASPHVGAHAMASAAAVTVGSGVGGGVGGGHSGSASSTDLFLAFPLGAAGVSGAAGGTIRHSASSCMTGGGSPRPVGSGGAVSDASSQEQRPISEGAQFGPPVVPLPRSAACGQGPPGTATSPPLLVPQRHVGAMQNGRVAAVAVAAAAATASSAAAAAATSVGTDSYAPGNATGLDSPISAGGEVTRDAVVMLPGNSSPPCNGSVTLTRIPTADGSVEPGAMHVSADVSGSLVVMASRSNSSYNTAAAPYVPARSSFATISSPSGAGEADSTSGGGGDRGRLTFIGGSGGCGGNGRRPSIRAGSVISTDITSQAVSPSCTWASGGSAGSTASTATVAAGSMSPAAASGAGLEQQHAIPRLLEQQQPFALKQAPCQNPRVQHVQPLRARLAAVGIGMGEALAAQGSDQAETDIGQQDDICTGGDFPGGGGTSSVVMPRGMVDSDSGNDGSGGGSGGNAGNFSDAAAAAAMAAAFGLNAPMCQPVDYGPSGSAGNAVAAAAAAFGVGPPVEDFGTGPGDGGGPTREQLALALELLGESRHAAAGAWH